MGCGNSKKVETVSKKKNSAEEFDNFLDKNIPKFFIEDPKIDPSVLTEEDRYDGKTDSDVIDFILISFYSFFKPSKKRNIKKAQKVRARDETDSQIYENINRIERKKGKNEIIFIIKVLKSHFVFYNLAETEL